MKNKKGFTLIEIIIVIIIIGVLAALALPKLSNQVNVSKAAEAYNTLGTIMRKVSECYTMSSEVISECDTSAELSGFNMPATTNNFTYVFPANAAGESVADCDSDDCKAAAGLVGSTSTNYIVFTLNAETGAITKEKEGIFKNLKN